jgi:hypothetical protein
LGAHPAWSGACPLRTLLNGHDVGGAV